MPDAVSVSVAKSVTAMLAAAGFMTAMKAVPERSYADWLLELDDSDCLHVDVVVVATEDKTDLVDRSTVGYFVPVDIGVRKKFGPNAQNDDTGRVAIEKVDELVLLVEQINEFFIHDRLTDFESGVWIETKIIVNPSKQHLKDMRQFLGIVRVTFEVTKAIA